MLARQIHAEIFLLTLGALSFASAAVGQDATPGHRYAEIRVIDAQQSIEEIRNLLETTVSSTCL